MKQSSSFSYDNLRLAIGILGIALPFLLVAGNGFMLEKSISFFYYTKMSTVFTGILITFGLILYTYRGTDLEGDVISENALTNWGGVFALLVALVPTKFDGTPPDTFYTHNDPIRGWFHNGSAVLFIFIMGLVVLLKFSKAQHYQGFYKTFGWLVMVGLAFTIYAFARGWENGPVFWGETFSLTCFGIAWIRRGIPK